MKKSILSIIVSFGLIVPTFSGLEVKARSGIEAEQVAPVISEVIVNLEKENVSLENLETVAAGLDLTEFQTYLQTDQDDVTFGYQLGTEQNINDAVQEFLVDTENFIAQEQLDKEKKLKKVLDLKLSNVTVKGNIEKVKEKFSKMKVSFEEKKGEASKKKDVVSIAATPSSITKDRTTPYKGKFSMITNTNGAFIYQNFTFSDWGISGFRGDIAKNSFELDTVFYNYDGKAWATKYGGTTQGTWWSSNLPSPYLDTQFGDDWAIYGGDKNSYGEPSEANLAVGSGNADVLEREKQYYYQIKVNKNSRADNWKLKLNAQPGKQYLTGAWGAFSYYTWRMYPQTSGVWHVFTEDVTYNWTR